MNEYTHESLQNEDRLDLLEHLHWNVQKDSSLTGATVDQVRDRFKTWIESPKAKIEGPYTKDTSLPMILQVTRSRMDPYSPVSGHRDTAIAFISMLLR